MAAGARRRPEGMLVEREDRPVESEGAGSGPVSARIRRLLCEQPFAVLCTQGEGQPYGSLVAVAVTDDLSSLVFATPRATRKYRLLSLCRRVSLVLDSRSLHPDDFMSIDAVTATGTATEIPPGGAFDSLARLLVERHPYQQAMILSPSAALFRVEVVRYFHVTRFQEVTQWVPGTD